MKRRINAGLQEPLQGKLYWLITWLLFRSLLGRDRIVSSPLSLLIFRMTFDFIMRSPGINNACNPILQRESGESPRGQQDESGHKNDDESWYVQWFEEKRAVFDDLYVKIIKQSSEE